MAFGFLVFMKVWSVLDLVVVSLSTVGAAAYAAEINRNHGCLNSTIRATNVGSLCRSVNEIRLLDFNEFTQ